MTVTHYEFDDDVKESIVALLCKDTDFCTKTEGLVLEDYFENEAEKVIVRIALRYFESYREAPTALVVKESIRELIIDKKLRKDLAIETVHKMKTCFEKEITSRAWILDNVCEFARQQAMINAIIQSSSLIEKTGDKSRFDKVKEIIDKANEVGSFVEEDDGDDYFEGIDKRTDERILSESGKLPPVGITTGIREIDEILAHKGYGRKELSVWMGPPKSGKSFALVQAGASAVLDGKNVLHVTLENSREICNMRYDSYFSKVAMNDRFKSPIAMKTGVLEAKRKSGILKVREFASGSFAPRDMRKLLDYYATKGIKFDLVVVDYFDIMRPDIIKENDLANHKSIWVTMRGIAFDWDLAMVTATQTNRTGATAAVARATDVAESFDKIRTADIVFSINRSDDEKAERKARIYLAAGRNQTDGVTVCVTQNLGIARSVDTVEGVE